MRNRIIVFILAISTIAITSCGTQNQNIIAKYGDYNITLDEFENAYVNSTGSREKASTDSIQNYKDFLDLYVKFKMKLRDAEVRALDIDPILQSEYENYKKSVGASYIIENEIISPNLKTLYDRKLNEIRVSHIMIKEQNDDDSKRIAEEVLAKLKSGESFEKLAAEYSKDNYSKNKGGDIYYFLGGFIVPEFEDAAYSLNVGEVYPEPVKTRFGYHIIKLTEKIPNRNKLNMRHILSSVRDSSNQVDTIKSLEKIKKVVAELKNGKDFSELAKIYSDDPGSKDKGGELGFVPRRKMVQPFDEAAFNLKVGETSDIVKTNFGYHIIQVTDEEAYPSFAEERENLLNTYKKLRYDYDLKNYVNKEKKNLKFIVNTNLINTLASKYDTLKFNNTFWESNAHIVLGDSIILSIEEESIPLDTLVKFANTNKISSNRNLDLTNINIAIDEYSKEKIIEIKAKNLYGNNKEFTKLMNEYKNGLYIFKIQEDEVWKNIKIDSVKLMSFYEKNKNHYMWEDRVDYSEIYCKSDSLINWCFSKLQEGVDFDSLAYKYSENQTLKKSNGRLGIRNVKENLINELAYKIGEEGQVVGPIEIEGKGWVILKTHKKYPSTTKTFEEAKPELISAFQESESLRLEKKYISKLNKLYEPELFYDKLKNALKPKIQTNFSLFIFALFLFGCSEEIEKPKSYLAKVEKNILTENDLNLYLGKKKHSKIFKNEFIKNWVDQELLFIEAKNSGIFENKDYKELADLANKQIAVSFVLKKLYTDSEFTISQNEILEYYNIHKNEFYSLNDSYIFNLAEFELEKNALDFRNDLFNYSWKNSIQKFNDVLYSNEFNLVKAENEIAPIQILRILKSLDNNEISIVLKTEQGLFVVVQLIDYVKKNRLLAFDSVKNKIEEILKTIKQKDMYLEYLDKLNSKYKTEIKKVDE